MPKASCHCGVTRIEVTRAPDRATRCTCSFCSKRGALWAYYTPSEFTLVSERNRVSTYQWQSFTVKHHHCAICACTTYTETPSWVDGKPDFDNPQIAVNVRLFDDVDIDVLPVEVIDGRNLW